MVCATGSTFGDNTSPGNFQPIADARKQLAAYFWSQDDTVDLAKKQTAFRRLVIGALPPTTAEITQFVPALRDKIFFALQKAIRFEYLRGDITSSSAGMEPFLPSPEFLQGIIACALYST
jgi:hypothetical protein